MNFNSEQILRDISRGRCYLFIGSGISSFYEDVDGNHFPNWEKMLLELLEIIKSSVEPEVNNGIEKLIADEEYLVAGQEVLDILTQDQKVNYFSKFKTEYCHEIHRIIVKIPFKGIITTNFDTLIENAFFIENNFPAPKYYYNEIQQSDNFLYYDTTGVILKLHGDIDDLDNIVLGLSKYKEIILNDSLKSVLTTVYLSNLVLIAGYSMKDFDFLLNLMNVNSVFNQPCNIFWLVKEGEINFAKKRQYKRNFGIEIIEYDPQGNHIEVIRFFRTLYEKYQDYR